MLFLGYFARGFKFQIGRPTVSAEIVGCPLIALDRFNRLRGCICCPRQWSCPVDSFASNNSPSKKAQMPNEKSKRLSEFTKWVATHIKGDEKGEAQIYLDRLFKGFGHAGWKEAGATCEERIKNDTGGTSFADLVWKPHVVVEMKKRGADLNKHYSQAFTYWTRLVPNRPRYAVLCNFDELWVFDFNTQLDTPVDKIKLADLPRNYGPLNFLFPGDIEPVFGNHNEAVTRQAADKLAECFKSMVKRKVDRGLAQRFILQTLMALFAEDIGLLEKYTFAQLLDECKKPEDTYDKLGGLFAAMNNKAGNHGGRYKGVNYFNGGLFADPAHIELVAEERVLLKEACLFDWSKVRPEIFGTLFERSLDSEERHASGAHFTTPVDIMKIVGPTIVEPWRAAIEATKTLTEMQELLHRMHNFTVLDPACGSGNFLFTAYREMKRLEAALYTRMADRFKSVDPNQRSLGFVTTTNFYGMDINPFAVEIAKVTMMLAHKLSIDELHVSEAALPLDNLDANIIARDALVMPDNSRSSWPKADVIIGNPPFLGAKLLKPELGADYVKRVRQAYPEIPGMADLCVYWFRRAQDALPPCTTADIVAGRAGLVGTQNIRSNASRKGGLDYVAASATIIEAVDSQPWSGEANVSVSIANWVNSQDANVVREKRRLWFKVAPKPGSVKRKRGMGQANKSFELDMREVSLISSSLSDATDVAQAEKLAVNNGFCFTGQYPRHNPGFLLPIAAAEKLLAAVPENKEVIWPFAGGDELLKQGKVICYSIDFQDKSIVEAQGYAIPFGHVLQNVLPHVQKLAEVEREKTKKDTGQDQTWLNTWWRFFRPRTDLVRKLNGLRRYMVCSRVTKRPTFMFLSADIRPSDSLSCFIFDDDYSFGVLQALPHQQWFVAKGSKLTERLRYTPESVFDTFPWPQSPTSEQVKAVADAAVALRKVRADSLVKVKGGLRSLYKAIDLPGKSPLKDAHERLDKAVLEAYGFDAKVDLLAQVLRLNASVAAKITSNEPVTGPGIPALYPTPADLVTADCILAP